MIIIILILLRDLDEDGPLRRCVEVGPSDIYYRKSPGIISRLFRVSAGPPICLCARASGILCGLVTIDNIYILPTELFFSFIVFYQLSFRSGRRLKQTVPVKSFFTRLFFNFVELNLASD